MKARAQSVGALLEPWVAEFARHGHAKLSYDTSPTGPASPTLEFVLSTLDAAFVSLEDVVRLREALGLLHLAALIDMANVEEAVAGLCYYDFDEPDNEDELCSKRGARTHSGVGEDVQFVLTFHGTRGKFLEEVVAPALFGDSFARSADFIAASAELAPGFIGQPKQLRCRVSVVSLDDSFDDEVEHDYIQRVVSFICILSDAHTGDSNLAGDQGQGQDQDQDRVPLCVSGVHLELNELAITSAAVDAVSSLADISVPVTCSRVAINPSALQCSAEELSRFLGAVGARTSEMTVEIGHVNLSELDQSIDPKGASQEQLIRTLFQGIAGASCVTSVSFGPLLALMRSPSNRKAVWTELFASLSAPSARACVSSLVISPQIELTADDSAFIREIVAVSSPCLHIEKLFLWLNESDPDAVKALVQAVSPSVKSIALHSEAHALTPATTVELVISSCVLLEKLSLTAAEVESMTIFTRDSTILQELTLNSVVLQDPASMACFLSTLAEPKTALARTLRKLHIRADNNAIDHLVISEEDSELVKHVLVCNKLVNDIELAMADGATDKLAAISKHDGEVLAKAMPLPHKIAFLSTTQPRAASETSAHRNRVDADAVRLIFDFAADRVSRHVYLDF